MLSALSGRMRRRDESKRQWQSEGGMGLGKKMESEKQWMEREMECMSEYSRVTPICCTHRHAHTHCVGLCPRRARGERYSSHYNYLSLSSASLSPHLSDKHIERHLHTKQFFLMLLELIASYTHQHEVLLMLTRTQGQRDIRLPSYS